MGAVSSIRRRRLAQATLFLFGSGILICGCSSHNEVQRLTSPDGKVDAIVIESDCGPVCDVVDDVELAPKGSHSGERVAWFDSAVRNENAWGVDLKWPDADSLSIEYLRADKAELLKENVDISGEVVSVSLREKSKEE